MCVNNLSKVALDSAAAGIEPATSSRKSNALTTAPPSHTREDHALISLHHHSTSTAYTIMFLRLFSAKNSAAEL